VITVAVSIKDIAKRANVAPSTVSRALKNSPWIGRDTRHRIRQLAREMGYVPSAAARSLVKGRSGMIGICLPELADASAAEQAEGVEEAAAELDCQILLEAFLRREEHELECVRRFQSWRAEGVIVLHSYAPASRPMPTDAYSSPVVAVNAAGYRHSVSCHRIEGLRLALRHLFDLGHRTIGFVLPPERERSAAKQRPIRRTWPQHHDHHPVLDECRSALGELGIPFRQDLFFHSEEQFAGGAHVAGEITEMRDPPTAVLAFSDLTVAGLVNGLSRAGMRVPEGLSVCTFDVHGLAAHHYPTLTAVRQPNRELGRLAFEMLSRLIRQEHPRERPREAVVLSQQLVTGTSTARPGARK
jgi:DNA-binding LacI/PurR family transcriptional regulator